MENNILSKWNLKASRRVILISNNTDFKPESVRRDEESHYISIKGIIHQGHDYE
jgi:hypothetical protein